MAPKYSKVLLFVWQFLNQPLFSSQHKAVLNPWFFWYIYQVRFLERCWAKECDAKRRHR